MKKQNNWAWILGLIIVIGAIALIAFRPSSSSNPSPTSKKSSSEKETSQVLTTIADSPYLGNKDKAKVAIVEYSDYECPFCKMFFNDTFDSLVKEYVDSGKAIFVYREFLGVGAEAAEKDSNAALCVRSLKDNAAYFSMAKLIYNNTGLEGQGIATEKMVQLATQAGVDETKFSACFSGDQFKDQIKKDTDDADAAGVTGTPSFIIGLLDDDGKVSGELLVGAQPLSTFERAINKYLE